MAKVMSQKNVNFLPNIFFNFSLWINNISVHFMFPSYNVSNKQVTRIWASRASRPQSFTFITPSTKLRLRHPYNYLQRGPLSIMYKIHTLVFRRLSLVKEEASKLTLYKIRNLSFRTGYYSIMLQAQRRTTLPLWNRIRVLQEQHEDCLWTSIFYSDCLHTQYIQIPLHQNKTQVLGQDKHQTRIPVTTCSTEFLLHSLKTFMSS